MNTTFPVLSKSTIPLSDDLMDAESRLFISVAGLYSVVKNTIRSPVMPYPIRDASTGLFEYMTPIYQRAVTRRDPAIQ